jgi:hypothetical protein
VSSFASYRRIFSQLEIRQNLAGELPKVLVMVTKTTNGRPVAGAPFLKKPFCNRGLVRVGIGIGTVNLCDWLASKRIE